MFMEDLGLDPSDPLNLLLRNGSGLDAKSQSTPHPQSGDSPMHESTAPSQDGGSPPDWSSVSAFWDDVDDMASAAAVAGAQMNMGGASGKEGTFPELMDFTGLDGLSFGTGMGMDFDPASMGISMGDLDMGINGMAVDPTSLQFDFAKMGGGGGRLFLDILRGVTLQLFIFIFLFDVRINNPAITEKTQYRSFTSASSASGVSPSPVTSRIAPENHTPGGANNTHNLSPVEELAQRVRQSAGMLLAVPMGAQMQQTQQMDLAWFEASNPASPSSLCQYFPSSCFASPSSSSSAASTPPPATPPPSAAPNAFPMPPTSNDPMAAAAHIAPSRPKTSHTTIERRYRTNLNARIQSLRMAVPALRVLEDREGGKVKVGVKGGVKMKGEMGGSSVVINQGGEDEGPIVDVIDERGFVDGVKVARKCSKANVLGKAVEYIRVLKRREGRLRAEQDGLKVLVSGLVGGPVLLREWESEWRKRFGGEEKDEVDGEEADDADGSEDEDEDDGEEDGRKRKRAKTVKKETKKEKEKPPAPTVDAVTGETILPEKRKRGRPRKVVVQPPLPSVPAPIQARDDDMSPFATPPAQGQQYLLATFALFSFFNSPLATSSSTSSAHTHDGRVLGVHTDSSHSSLSVGWGWRDGMQLVHLVATVAVLVSVMWPKLSHILGFGRKAANDASERLGQSKKSIDTANNFILRSSSTKQAKQKINASRSSLRSHLNTYHRLSSLPNPSPRELATLALFAWSASYSVPVVGHLVRLRAHSIWDSARALADEVGKEHERLLLQMSVSEAHMRVRALAAEGGFASGTSAPELLAGALVKEHVRDGLAQVFVKTVCMEEEYSIAKEENEEEKDDNVKMVQVVIAAAKELGGDATRLGRILENALDLSSPASTPTPWNGSGMFEQPSCSQSTSGETHIEEEIHALQTALTLYRRVFSADAAARQSGLLSPPPSPGRRGGEVGALRKALGCRVFERPVGPVVGLEDARDRAVDLIVEYERRGRRLGE
ncbi:hypothetical protein BD779DRAFT_1476160 [Infundibulicybe gibba]|nr:hypothetical protein BD779DRAFT_1476160 [Infundibulicybe gibba]